MFKRSLPATIIISIYLILSLSCTGNSRKSEKGQQEATMIEVSIGGMTCLGCEQTIQSNVGKLDGIKSIKASFTTGNAVIEYFPDKVDTLEIREAITGSGYLVNKFLSPGSEETK